MLNSQDVQKIDVTTVKRAIESGEDIILIDVRTREEYSRGKIKGSFNIPVDEIEEEMEKAIPDKESRIYVYCLSGSRSLFAVRKILELGYKRVFDVSSGLLAWRAKGYPTTGD